MMRHSLWAILLLVGWVSRLHAQDYRTAPPEEGGGLQIRVFVMGEVKLPGTYWVKDGATLLDAIATAGGPTDQANLKGVRVTRKEGKASVVYNLDAYILAKAKQPPPELNPGDVVYVPAIATVRWMRMISILRDVALVALSYISLQQQLGNKAF